MEGLGYSSGHLFFQLSGRGSSRTSARWTVPDHELAAGAYQKGDSLAATPYYYPLRYPLDQLIETIRPLIEVHWGV